MITINKNTTNEVVLTLREKQTLADSDWLFKFVNDSTGQIKLFTSQDLSTATVRYNLFNIIENPTENFYNGTVELLVGYWTYTIYEMTPSSPVDLDPLNAIKIVEQGKVFVNDLTPSSDVYFDNDEAINNVVFDA